MVLAHGGHGGHGSDGAAAGWTAVVLLALLPLSAYVRAVRTRRAGGRRWSPWRTASFAVGLVLAAAAVSPPVQAFGHLDPRWHMVEHLLIGMFAPLALVLAAPVTLLLGALPPAGRRAARRVLRSRALHVVVHPVTAAVLDVGGLHVLYLTPLHALAASDPLVHLAVNLHVLAAGYLFSWSIAGPDPAPGRPGIAVRAAVLVAAGAAHAHLAVLLYVHAPDLPPASAHDAAALRAAAQLMYYGGDLAELALAVALFAAWYRGRGLRDRTSSQAAQPAEVSVPGPASSRRGARSG